MTSRSSDIILQRMMTLHPKIIDLTLDRVWRLLALLGDPHLHLPPVIHIAGTNGKGSVQAMLRAGLEGAGGWVHAYTSPHLVRFHERIRMAGRLISERQLRKVLDECEAANGHQEITYFEITTVAALLAFARTPADWTLLEVGLGGRFDATNVIDKPRLCVITPVSIDHQQYLGDTLAEIAGEKAGILKPGVTGVVGPQDFAALEVIENRAARVGAPLMIHGQHWHAWEERGRLIVQDERGLADLPLPNLIGAHQIANAGTAVVALRALGQTEDAWEAAVSNANWPARMQRLTRGPIVKLAPGIEFWLDGGHNAAAGSAMAAHLQSLPRRPTYIIAGMLSSKDPQKFFRPLAPLIQGLCTVTIPGETASLSAGALALAAGAAGIEANAQPGIEDCVSTIAAKDPGARIMICGSLYLAGKVLRDHG